MKYLLLQITLLFSWVLNAQTTELKALNKNLNEVLAAATGLHVEYDMVMKGKVDSTAQVDTMKVSVFKKKGNDYKMLMGKEQVLLQDKSVLLKINHSDKIIVVEELNKETTNEGATELLVLEELNTLADSAVKVTFLEEKKHLVYNLEFSNSFTYTSAKLVFSAKTKLLNELQLKFNPNQEGYGELYVNYTLWDLAWKETGNELSLNNYVSVKDNEYKPVVQYQDYEVYKPEKGQLNVDLTDFK